MSSGLSASCSTAISLSDDYDGKVQVADNHRISVTQRESVMHAKKLAEAGKSAKEIKEVLEAEAYNLSLIHISEPTRRTPISYAVFCLKKKNGR